MASVTQTVSNYLGGVSKQTDDKKMPGQVRECLNALPDPTFGLMKRPGFKFEKQLATSNLDNAKWFYIHRDGDEKYIGRISTGSPGDIAIWNAATGVACTVNYDALPWLASTEYKVGDQVVNGDKVYQCNTEGESDTTGGPTGITAGIVDNDAIWDYVSGRVAQAYLTTTRDNYDILTVQDTTFVTNKTSTVTEQTAPAHTANKVGTVFLNSVKYSTKYEVTINGTTTASFITRNDDSYTAGAAAFQVLNADDILTQLETNINALGISGLTVEKLETSLELSCTSAFTLKVSDDDGNNHLTSFQEKVGNLSLLPFHSVQDRLVKIVNTSAAEDNYWALFSADDGVKGKGEWEEWKDPNVSPGFNSSTMPHELFNVSQDTFIFRPYVYTDRKVGDLTTNSNPSFVGNTIQQTFFHNDRLGFLTKDNVVMSVANNVHNFFFTSALTSTDADPIDISCSSIRPAQLHGIIPTAQGLVLFSENQQFILFSDSEILTPSSAVIRGISNYEMDTVIDPVDVGTSINFVSKTPSYTRVFGMSTRGSGDSPVVNDVGKIISEWIPDTITSLISSPQNSLIALYGVTSNLLYMYKTYSAGEKNLMQAWVKWQFPGDIQFAVIDSDVMYSVVKNGNNYDLLKASMTQTPEEEIIITSTGQQVNPHMDYYAAVSSINYLGIDALIITSGGTGYTSAPTVNITPIGNGSGATATATVTNGEVTGITLTAVGNNYDAGATVSFSGGSGSNATATCTVYDRSKCYLPYSDISTLTPVLVIAGNGTTNFSGVTESGFTISPDRGTDGTGDYFEVPNKDISSLSAADVIVGYKYNYDVLLPKTYFKADKEGSRADYTANLTIARMKFSVGLSSVVGFKVKSKGYRGPLEEFTGDGSTTAFTVPFVLKEENGIRVTLDGATTTAYTFTTTDTTSTVTFNTAPSGAATAANVTTPAQKIAITTDTWYDVQPVQEAGQYLADDVPLAEDNIFTIPIHQRTNNFNLRVFSNSPFPVSLISMSWEGNYSPKFYRRT